MCIQRRWSIASAVALGIVPVALHHDVAAGEELARFAARHRASGFRVDDLDLDVRMHLADGGAAVLERLVAPRLACDRRGLGHAEADAHLVDPHLASLTRFITSIGQGEPAMIPVRSEP